ncbi:MAG: Lrp/AsnC family transcriptional regulator [Rhodospirillaceae bacterium]|nr:MAG: Lrp/AsnC family transcriptional regulator [Rhodospirillaceae bacterium]
MTELDPVDRKLLSLLKQNAAAKYAELGQQLNLSAPAVFERVKRLRKSGAIRRYTVDVTPAATGFGLGAYILVYLKRRTCEEVFQDLGEFPEIEECHSLAGEASMMLKVRTGTSKDLETLICALWHVDGIDRTVTMLMLDTYHDDGVRVA